tara:strand:- start:1729 stop:2682 length:954 start_codon:yes stop_codon:yes gene_type:complete
MKKQTKLLLYIGIVVIVLIAAIFLFSNQGRQGQETIKIGSFSKAIDYAPYLVAKNKGWFDNVAENYGTNVEYIEFQSLAPINEAFATNNIDLVFEAEAPAIVGKSAGIDLKIVDAGVFLTQEIIIPQDSSVQDVKGLEGKKIAVLAGTSAHYGLVNVLNENGLSATNVEIIDMTPPDAKVAFELGQVDAWAVWPPFPQQEEVSGKGKSLSGSKIFIQSVVVARGKFIEQNPEIEKDLLEVVSQAQEWIIENEAESQEIVAEELNLDLEVVVKSWPKHDFNPVFNEETKQDIKTKADFLYEQGIIKNQVDVESLVEVK